jgi:hypothetical protein
MTKKETFKWVVQIIALIAMPYRWHWERCYVVGNKQKKRSGTIFQDV